MDVVVVELRSGSEHLDLLSAAMEDACRVARINQRATELDAPETTQLRLQLAKTILEGMNNGERDPANLRVAALRSTIRCCVSDGEILPRPPPLRT